MANPNPSPSTRFQPGIAPNPGGRPKKLLLRIDEMCAKEGKHPYTELMKLLPELKPREQAEVWMTLLSYCTAKPIKHEAEPDPIADIPTAELAKQLLTQLPMLEMIAKGA